MNILVTGGAGYIGSHTCKALARHGHTPITYDNLSTGHKWAVRWGPLVVGDLCDSAHLAQTLREHAIEAVVHFAANSLVGESHRNPRKYYRNNLLNTLNMLDTMLDARVNRLIFSSTCATYGQPQSDTLDESHPQNPVNPYGETKLAIERALHWYATAHNFRYIALRYFNAAGASPDAEIGEAHDPETHLIPLILEAALNPARPISIYGTDYPTPDGTAIRDYIHVDDLAAAHVKAFHYLQNGARSAAFNLGTGRGYSVREVIAAVEQITNRPVARQEIARREGDPVRLIAAAQKANKELGWKPIHSDIKNIVQTAWQWRQNQAPQMVTGIQDWNERTAIRG